MTPARPAARASYRRPHNCSLLRPITPKDTRPHLMKVSADLWVRMTAAGWGAYIRVRCGKDLNCLMVIWRSISASAAGERGGAAGESGRSEEGRVGCVGVFLPRPPARRPLAARRPRQSAHPRSAAGRRRPAEAGGTPHVRTRNDNDALLPAEPLEDGPVLGAPRGIGVVGELLVVRADIEEVAQQGDGRVPWDGAVFDEVPHEE